MFEKLKGMVRSLHFKLLASLLLLLGFSIAVSLFGIWTYERDRYSDIARAEAMRAARTMEKSLRRAMLANDWEMIRHTVADIQEIVAPSSISILAVDGTVALSSRDDLTGRRFIRERDPECTVCHLRPGLRPEQTAVLMESEAGPLLRNVIKVVNEPACHRCHSPAQKTLGVFIYDAPFGEILTMLRTVLFRTALTGLATFAVMIVVLTMIVRRYVQRPLQQLEAGFIQVGRGDFEHWVEIENGGDIQDMADQFNVMNQAIKRSFAEIKRKNWETEQLYAFVRQLGQVTEWRHLRRVIIELLLATFRADRAALLLHREKRETMATEVAWRRADDRRYYHREYQKLNEAGELPEWLTDAWGHWQRQPAMALEFSGNDTVALAPLASQNISLGLLCLGRPADRPFSGLEKKLLAALVEQIEIALANARLNHLAITDSLTGLYSKRYCESMFRKFFEAYEVDPNRVFSVLMLDLDHFKQVNDTHGHQVGDEVLVQLGELIRAQIRHDDVACRYGGEEFIVLVADDLEAGCKLASRLVQAVAAHHFRCGESLELHNTISIGVAAFPGHGRSADEVIGAADQALYQAKHDGRNRYLCYQENE